MPRHPAAVRLLLVAFGLVPIGAWIAIASSIEPSGLGRSIGQAILVVLSPIPFGGLLMVLGAVLRPPRAGRVVATVGAAIVGLGAATLAAIWASRVARCGGPEGVCTPELVEALGLLGYGIVHAALIAAIWRQRRLEATAR